MKNKVIVVTGGNGLLGKELIRYIKEKGAVAINGDLNCVPGEEDSLPLDITSEESVKSFIRLVVNKYGRIDGWVNNAYPRTSDWGNKFEDITIDSWRKNIDMHLNGYFLCSKWVLQQMKEQGFGSLVNMGSIYGVQGPDFSIYEGLPMTMPAAYAAIKGAIINLTRYLASYFGPYHVRVNCVSPGGIEDNQHAVFIENYKKKVPLNRLGSPSDISPVVCFLLSDEAGYVTGQNIIIDGGFTII